MGQPQSCAPSPTHSHSQPGIFSLPVTRAQVAYEHQPSFFNYFYWLGVPQPGFEFLLMDLFNTDLSPERRCQGLRSIVLLLLQSEIILCVRLGNPLLF